MRTAIVIAALWATAAAAQDEVQTWVDEEGEVHYTNDPSQVPAQYRRTMKRTAGDGALSVIPSPRAQPPNTASAQTSASPEPKLDEAYWRRRFREARKRISELEDALREQKPSSPSSGARGLRRRMGASGIRASSRSSAASPRSPAISTPPSRSCGA